MIEMKPVKSSNIAAIGRCPDTGEVHVRFHSGVTHAYEGVDEEGYGKLLGAKSVGSHFHQHVRHRKSRKVEPEKAD